MKKSLSQALELAMKLEKDGIEFYGKASQETAHPLGRQMFLSIVAEEEVHLRELQEMTREVKNHDQPRLVASADDKILQKDSDIFTVKPLAVGGRSSRGNGKTLFDQARAEIRERIAGNPDELEALRIAMEMEVEGFRLYRKMAREASDLQMKAFFDFLADQENEHFQTLRNTQAYLEDPERWLLWEEEEIADAG